MNGASQPAGLIDEAREALEAATRRALCAGGENFESCRGPLERAAGRLDGALAALRHHAEDAGGAGAALNRLRRELRTFTALHENAAAFYLGWAGVVADLDGQAYARRKGAELPVLVAPGRRLSLEA